MLSSGTSRENPPGQASLKDNSISHERVDQARWTIVLWSEIFGSIMGDFINEAKIIPNGCNLFSDYEQLPPRVIETLDSVIGLCNDQPSTRTPFAMLFCYRHLNNA